MNVELSPISTPEKDLVERLRIKQNVNLMVSHLLSEAADEIERLRALISVLTRPEGGETWRA